MLPLVPLGIVGMHVFNSRAGLLRYFGFWNYFTKVLIPGSGNILSYVMRMVSKD